MRSATRVSGVMGLALAAAMIVAACAHRDARPVNGPTGDGVSVAVSEPAGGEPGGAAKRSPAVKVGSARVEVEPGEAVLDVADGEFMRGYRSVEVPEQLRWEYEDFILCPPDPHKPRW